MPGNPARVILDTVAREEPDLLIMGPHERRGVVDALQGTIAEKVVSARNCPVLVVQQSAKTTYRNVLLALDVAAGSRAAVRAAERFVLRDGAQATVIHACASADHAVLQAADMEAAGVGLHADCSPGAATVAMRDLLEQESADPRRYELVVAQGNPLPTILRAIGKRQPDLLIMGTRGDGRMRRAVLGSVANQLLKVAPCDILIVPRGASEALMATNPESTTLSSAQAVAMRPSNRSSAMTRKEVKLVKTPSTRDLRRILCATDLTARSMPALLESGVARAPDRRKTHASTRHRSAAVRTSSPHAGESCVRRVVVAG